MDRAAFEKQLKLLGLRDQYVLISRDYATGKVETVWLRREELEAYIESKEREKWTTWISLNEKTSDSNHGVTGVSVIWFDLDTPHPKGSVASLEEKQKTWARVQRLMAYMAVNYSAAGVIVDSGNGFHVYFPIRRIEAFEGLNSKFTLFIKRLNEETGVGLDSTADLRRVVGVVGSYNYKVPSNPLPVRFVQGDDLDPDFLRTRNEQLRKAVLDTPVIEPVPVAVSEMDIDKAWSIVRDDPLLTKIVVQGDVSGYPSRSEAEMAAVTKMVSYNMPPGVIDTVMQQSQSGKWAEAGESYRKLTIAKAMKFAVQNPVPAGGKAAINQETDRPDPFMLATAIEEKVRVMEIRSDGASERGTYYWYDNGRWRLGAEQVIKTHLVRLCEQNNWRYSKQLLSNVIDIIGARNFTVSTPEPPPYLVNLKNGILDLNTMSLMSHEPRLFFLYQIPVAYNPNASCPNFLKIASQIVGDDQMPTLQEAVGYTLYRENFGKKAFLFYGEGNNGKSLLLRILERFFGQENVAHIQLHYLATNNFAVAELFGKLVNIWAELPDETLESSDMFRVLTGGDEARAEFKHRTGFSFRPYVKLWFSANKLFRVHDQDLVTFFNRWVIFTCPNKFSTDLVREQELLEAATTEEELSGVLNWAVEGIRRLLQTRSFSGSVTGEKLRDTWLRMSDSVYAWFRDNYEFVPGSVMDRDALFGEYEQYCTSLGIKPTTKQWFVRRLKAVEPRIQDEEVRSGSRSVVIKNIGLKGQAPTGETDLERDILEYIRSRGSVSEGVLQAECLKTLDHYKALIDLVRSGRVKKSGEQYRL